MRIAIMGSGGMGGFLGGMLARAGEDVVFIARGTQLAALRGSGLSVHSRLCGDFAIPVRAVGDPTEVGPVDLVIFAVKTYDLDTAAEAMRPLIGQGTVVLPVQNGVDIAERVGRTVGREHVLGGVSWVTAHVELPGVINHVQSERVVLGELPAGTSPRVEQVAAVLRRAGIPAEAHARIMLPIWEKFLPICGFGGLSALTRLPAGSLHTCVETRDLILGIMTEAEHVAQALAVGLAPGAATTALALFAKVATAVPGMYPSLYHDLIHGRRLEVDAINGAVVRLGRARGVATPLNYAIHAALKPLAGGATP
jgi:2-dehydropantoate 2-reductase